MAETTATNNNTSVLTPYPTGTDTLEGAQREAILASRENFNPVSDRSLTTPQFQWIPDISWMDDIPDYQARLRDRVSGVREIARGITYSIGDSHGPLYGTDLSAYTQKSPYDPNGYEVPVSETHTRLNSGDWISKYPQYFSGIDNEDLYARQQSTGNKVWHGVTKFTAKVGLNVFGNLAMIPDKLIAWARYGNAKAMLNTDLEKWLDDLNVQVDYSLPHYYRKEARDYNFWQKMWKDGGNFWWNDVLGDGMAFTVGALLTGYITGGLGLSSLGNAGAKLGFRLGSKAALRGAGGIAGREAYRSGVGTVKSMLKSQARGAMIGRTVGNLVGMPLTMALTAGYEATVESNSFIKESQNDFRQYYKEVYGRNPTAQEMSEFTESVKDVAGVVFGSNLAIVGLSNWLLFGKYIGLSAKMVPGIGGRIGKTVDAVGDAFSDVGRAGRRIIFGQGVRGVTDEAGRYSLQVVNQNLAQKIAAHTFNISKRPLSEGLFEEGLQGVTQHAADEYVRSRYDNITMDNVVDYLDAIKNGFTKQYTSKEGWNEIGIGAIIGTFFGVRSGFGLLENSRVRDRYSKAVTDYNNNYSNLNASALNTLKQAINLGPQISTSADDMGNRELDDAVFAKLAMEDQLGLLGDSYESFEAVLNGISAKDLADMAGIMEEEVSEYKRELLKGYRNSMSNYMSARNLADAVIGEFQAPEFREYIARNAYLGITAYSRLDAIADLIGDLSQQEDVKEALKIYSTLSEETRRYVDELDKARDRVTEIQKKLNEYASRPRGTRDDTTDSDGNNVTGDPLSAEIQRMTIEIEEARAEYQQKMNELSQMKAGEFNLFDFINRTNEVLGSVSVTAEQIVQAHDALNAFDNYFSYTGNKGIKSEAKREALKGLIREYRENLVEYRSMTEFLARMQDRRFMRNEYRLFERALNRFIHSEEENEKNREPETQPDFIQTGVFRGYAADEAVDRALKEGRITEDEAYTIKAFMHSADRLRRRRNGEDMGEDEGSGVQDRVPEEEMQPWLAEDRDLAQVAREQPNLVDRITVAIQTGTTDSLSPRERSIYNNNQEFFDQRAETEGFNVLGELTRLRREVDDITSRENILQSNRGVVEFVKRHLSEEDRKRLDELIDKYNELSEKQDRGEEVNEEELQSARDEINNIGHQVIDENENQLTDFIDQSRRVQSNRSGQSHVVRDYADSSDGITDVTSAQREVTSKQKKSKTDKPPVVNLQNPEILTARREGNIVTISGFQAPSLLGRVKGKEAKLKRVDGQSIVVQEDTSNNVKKWIVTIADGVTVKFIDSGTRGRFSMTVEDAALLSEHTNMAIIELSTAYSAVYERHADESGRVYYTPFRTGVGFGSEGKDKIDQDALKEVNEGDSVSFIVDMNDDYNNMLYEEYEKASDKDKKAALDRLVQNIVVRVEVNGKFVSVLKSGESINKINYIRAKAAEEFIKKRGENSSSSSRVEIEIKNNPGAGITIPGRPNFLFERNSDGSYRVISRPITEKGAKNIYGVGYVKGGVFHMKTEDGKTDYMYYPYVIELQRRSEQNPNEVYPVVALKLPNGRNVLYPVTPRGIQSEDVGNAIDILEQYIQELEQNGAIEVMMNSNVVSFINNVMAKIGLAPNLYQLSYTSNSVSTIRKCLEAIRANGMVADVETWTTDNRSVGQVAVDEVLINIDVEGEMFVAPMMKIRFGENTENNEIEGLSETEVADKDIMDDSLFPPFGGSSETLTETEESGTEAESEEEAALGTESETEEEDATGTEEVGQAEPEVNNQHEEGDGTTGFDFSKINKEEAINIVRQELGGKTSVTIRYKNGKILYGESSGETILRKLADKYRKYGVRHSKKQKLSDSMIALFKYLEGESGFSVSIKENGEITDIEIRLDKESKLNPSEKKLIERARDEVEKELDSSFGDINEATMSYSNTTNVIGIGSSLVTDTINKIVSILGKDETYSSFYYPSSETLSHLESVFSSSKKYEMILGEDKSNLLNIQKTITIRKRGTISAENNYGGVSNKADTSSALNETNKKC